MGRSLGVKNGERSRFCLRGHDKTITRRSQNGACRACDNTRNKSKKWKKLGVIKADGSVFTPIDYDREYQIQGGCCKVCTLHQTELSRSLRADHDHVTKIFRGILCQSCNHLLGNAKDSVDILQNAINYLSKRF